jgi:anti-sigma B factor antagonist
MSGRSTDEFSPFSLHAQAFGREVLLTASGELDLAAVPAINSLVADVVTSDCRQVVVDTSDVSFIDCAGLRSLIAGVPPDVRFVLRSPSQAVRRLLELSELCELVEVAQPLGPAQEQVA